MSSQVSRGNRQQDTRLAKQGGGRDPFEQMRREFDTFTDSIFGGRWFDPFNTLSAVGDFENEPSTQESQLANQPSSALSTPTFGTMMPLDVHETDNTYELVADVPGVPKDHVHVDVDGDLLTIRADRKQEKKDEGERGGIKWHRTERSSGLMRRSMKLPTNVDADQIAASCDQGVLRISLPKRPEQGSKTRRIDIR